MQRHGESYKEKSLIVLQVACKKGLGVFHFMCSKKKLLGLQQEQRAKLLASKIRDRISVKPNKKPGKSAIPAHLYYKRTKGGDDVGY